MDYSHILNGEVQITSKDELYGREYYAKHCGPFPYDRTEPHWPRFFGSIADELIRSFGPRRVFDAGCAHGFLVEALWDRGVEAWGRDISAFAISQVRPDVRRYCLLGSIADPIEGRYDLVTCIEVLEHMEEAAAIQSIAAMAKASDRILFSSTPNDFEEPTHYNVKPIIYWLSLFAARGFSPRLTYDATFITPHAILLERSEEVPREEDLAACAELVRTRLACAERDRSLREVSSQNSDLVQRAEAAEAQLAAAEAQLTKATQRAEAAETAAADSERGLTGAVRALQAAEAAHGDIGQELARLRHDHAALLGSTAWLMTYPLRRLAELLPVGLRRLLRGGAKLVWWTIRLELGGKLRERRNAASQEVPKAMPESALAPEPPSDDYTAWIRLYDTITEADRSAITAAVARIESPPLISVVMPVYETAEDYLRAAIDSVCAQLYPHWELCIADDGSTSPHVRTVLEEYRAGDARIKVCYRAENGHIAAASNSALALAKGLFVALFDHDDILPEHALYTVAASIAADPEVDLIFSDEDKIDAAGQRFDPYFKSDWNPDLMLSQNAFSHLGVYRRSLTEKIGGFRLGFEGSQDYDLVLRASAHTTPARIRHIPHVLYHWRAGPGSVALSGEEKTYAAAAARRALADHLRRQGIAATVSASAWPGYHRVNYQVPEPMPDLSLIVPTRDRVDLLRQCVDGLLLATDYPNLEILIVDNGSERWETHAYLARLVQEPRVRILRYPGPFNFSAINNYAVAEAQHDIIGLINNDIEVIHPDWLHEMVSHVVRPGVGAVGAKLYYPNDCIQHAGVIVGLGGVAGHSHLQRRRGDIGYFGRAGLWQNLSAVTAACVLMPKAVYLEVGGLDEENVAIAFNDIDLCLRIRERGYRIVWTPYAELYHHESATRGSDEEPGKIGRFHTEISYMERRWGATLQTDPFYNPNLSLTLPEFALAYPPRVSKPWSSEFLSCAPFRSDTGPTRRVQEHPSQLV